MTEEQVTGYRGEGTGKDPDSRFPTPHSPSGNHECPALDPQHGLRPHQLQFLAQVVPPALQSERDDGIPACITIAQAILESAAKVQVRGDRGQVAGEWCWGASTLFREANNPFGIKHLHHSGQEPYEEFSAQTYEVEHGKLEEQRALFQRFPDLESAFRAHATLFLNSPRYKPAVQELRLEAGGLRPDSSLEPLAAGWRRFAVAIMNCGYSTDRPELCKQPGCPHYAGKLIKLVNDYRLNDARALAWYAEGKDPGLATRDSGLKPDSRLPIPDSRG